MFLKLSKRDWVYIVVSALVTFILADMYRAAKVKAGVSTGQ
jgi:hypothetical protein